VGWLALRFALNLDQKPKTSPWGRGRREAAGEGALCNINHNCASPNKVKKSGLLSGFMVFDFRPYDSQNDFMTPHHGYYNLVTHKPHPISDNVRHLCKVMVSAVSPRTSRSQENEGEQACVGP
jgi:hypothetical protein